MILLSKPQPQIIDSLFAINNLLLFFVNFIVASRPAIPGIAATVISNFFFVFLRKLKLFRICILLFLYFFLLFDKWNSL